MPAIYDDKGTEIADIPLSEKQHSVLETGERITVIFHTPQMLRTVLGERNGSFTLRKVMEWQRIVTAEPEAVKEYAAMQKTIKAARGE